MHIKSRSLVQEDWPPPNFAAWLAVAWCHDLDPQFNRLSQYGDLPDTFESPDQFIHWLCDRKLFRLGSTDARVVWRRFVNWRARKNGEPRPPPTDVERENRLDHEALKAFGLLPDPIGRRKVFA